MTEYKTKQALTEEISKKAKLFIDEFADVANADKDKLVDGVDRTPAQMIAYQLGWMNLILEWENKERCGIAFVMPHPDYKWNNLGKMYESFYKQYENESLTELCSLFDIAVQDIICLVDSYTDAEFFESGIKKWASSTPSNWPVWKWIHINTVSPFASFRGKIRKWKKA